jgi:hypothetical protein
VYKPLEIETLEVVGFQWAMRAMRNPMMSHANSTTEKDLVLAGKLIRAGDEHAKAVRGIVVYFELKCQIAWFVEWNTYRIGVEVLSTSSTMHLNHRGIKGIELAEAKQADLPNVVYTQTSMASYQALRRIYQQRRHHRHPDWQIFCDWIETLPNKELILCGL